MSLLGGSSKKSAEVLNFSSAQSWVLKYLMLVLNHCWAELQQITQQAQHPCFSTFSKSLSRLSTHASAPSANHSAGSAYTLQQLSKCCWAEFFGWTNSASLNLYITLVRIGLCVLTLCVYQTCAFTNYEFTDIYEMAFVWSNFRVLVLDSTERYPHGVLFVNWSFPVMTS